MPFTRGAAAAGVIPDGWDVRALVVDEGPEDANRTVLDELERGSTSVLLDPQAIGIAGPADLAAVLNGVYLNMTTVALVPGPATNEVAGWLLDLWEASGVAEAERRGHLGLDPFGVAARYGGPPMVDTAALDLVVRARSLPGVRALEVDATPYADAGTSDAGQLASALSTGVAYLRALRRWRTRRTPHSHLVKVGELGHPGKGISPGSQAFVPSSPAGFGLGGRSTRGQRCGHTPLSL